MALTLEEIKKLPPHLRIQKLKEFEEEQKKKREEEEKKLKKEEEEIIKKTIDELAEEKKEKEEEQKTREKEEEKIKKPTAPLEEIAEEAKPLTEKQKREQQEYQVRQSEYVANLAKRPISEIYSQLSEIREQFQERGYLTQNQMDRAQNLTEAVYQKEKSGYNPGEKARFLMSEAERVKEEMGDLLKVARRYH